MKGKLVQLAWKVWPGRLNRAGFLISTLISIVGVLLYV